MWMLAASEKGTDGRAVIREEVEVGAFEEERLFSLSPRALSCRRKPEVMLGVRALACVCPETKLCLTLM